MRATNAEPSAPKYGMVCLPRLSQVPGTWRYLQAAESCRIIRRVDRSALQLYISLQGRTGTPCWFPLGPIPIRSLRDLLMIFKSTRLKHPHGPSHSVTVTSRKDLYRETEIKILVNPHFVAATFALCLYMRIALVKGTEERSRGPATVSTVLFVDFRKSCENVLSGHGTTISVISFWATYSHRSSSSQNDHLGSDCAVFCHPWLSLCQGTR